MDVRYSELLKYFLVINAYYLILYNSIKLFLRYSMKNTSAKAEYNIAEKDISASEIINYWRVQESLLQTYRRFHFTVQAIYIGSVYITINTKGEQLSSGELKFLIIVLFILSIIAFIIMERVIKFRAKLVTYWQEILRNYELKKFDKIPKNPFSLMKQFESIYDVDEVIKSIHESDNTTSTRFSITIIMWIFAYVVPWAYVLLLIYLSNS